jgi:hypothetical protein
VLPVHPLSLQQPAYFLIGFFVLQLTRDAPVVSTTIFFIDSTALQLYLIEICPP